MKRINNKRVNTFFKQLIVNKIDDINAKQALQGNSLTLVELLQKELMKPKLVDKILMKRKNMLYTQTENERDIGKITLILKIMPEFKKFIRFNNIDHEAIRHASNYIEYKKVLKGTYIFRQGENSDYFYCIIKGKVSIREESKIVIHKNRGSYDFFRSSLTNFDYENEHIETVEKEKIILINGQYFGDWGILEKKPRNANAYALEDTELFYIDSKSFEVSFGKCMLKAENKRKNLLTSVIKPLRDLPRSKFNHLFKSMIILFLSKNEIVYLEGSQANYLYVIYEGVFRLQKRDILSKNDKNSEFLKSEVSKHHIVLKLDKGDLAGMESIIFYNSDPSSNKYKYSLVAENEFNIVIAINPKLLGTEIRNKVTEYLSPLFEQKEVILNKIVEGHMAIRNKMKITFREELIKQILKNQNQYYTNQIDSIIQETTKSTIDTNRQSFDKTPTNEFRSFRSVVNDNNINGADKNDIININDGPNEFSNFYLTSIDKDLNLQQNSNRIENKLSRLKQKIILPLAKDYCIERFNSVPTTERLENSDKTSCISSNLQRNLFLNNKLVLGSKSSLASPSSTKLASLPVTERKLSLVMGEKTLQKNQCTTERVIKLDNNKRTSHYVQKYIAKSVEKWNKLKISTNNDYDTGNFELPLVSQIR